MEIFWEYLLMASLSLFFFNLLPLPYLDGSQFLDTILEASLRDPRRINSDEYELEAVEERRRPRRNVWWKEVLRWLIPELTTGLLAVCTLVGTLNVYWH
ncbi:hypothetical protein E4T56_gene9593 [Termitomyces sp. T112]|nr:hypothetical protein E4T56_gene9593 [Termitomyces sp. T112]